jgi:hypothetical protein
MALNSNHKDEQSSSLADLYPNEESIAITLLTEIRAMDL